MALLNGDIDAQERPKSPTQYLGKRKRTASPEVETRLRGGDFTDSQVFKDALQLIRKHDPSAMILKYPLSIHGDDGRTIKRQRTETPDNEGDNIESRVSKAVYKSIDDMIDDVKTIKDFFTHPMRKENGFANGQAITKEQINRVLEGLASLQSVSPTSKSPQSTSTSSSDEQQIPSLPPSQVLSLRSQTEGGIKQLFSGLPRNATLAEVDGRKLPNGFELTDILTVDRNDLQGKDARKFGDVFASHRNTKTLEMPRGTRQIRGNKIGFIPPYENISNTTRGDYKFANLSAGLWLKYSVVDKSSTETDSEGVNAPAKVSALFKGAFSTFAPTTDNRHSIITDHERSQQWWIKYGRPAVGEALFTIQPENEITPQNEGINDISDKELEEMVANFVPDDEQITEDDKVLNEISELIETLSSYQSMRSLEVARGPSSASKPSKDEQNTYELLRNHLQLLISTLPPFAVAKLNGDQLDELNISTCLLVTPPEFVGTGQADDYTMRKNRVTQTATSTAGRNPVPVANRTAYGTPASAYNAQARAYNNIPSSAYVARPPNLSVYNTPRPTATAQAGSYTQPQYRPNGPSVHTPSVQQFQRPAINGYGSAVAQTPQTPYAQRPSQSSYQQRAQDSTTYGTVQKSMVNGDALHYQQRQYATPNHNYSSASSVAGHQQISLDASKQQQASGTPQSQTQANDGAIAAT